MGMKNRDGIARTLSRWQLALGRMAWWRFLLVVTIATFAAKLLIIVLCSLVADLDRTMDPGRAERLGCMAAERGDDTVRMEEIYELMEGMARYVEADAGFRLGSYTEADKWLFRTDRSAYLYATGLQPRPSAGRLRRRQIRTLHRTHPPAGGISHND